MLRLDDVHAQYGAIAALRGVSLEVREGELVALVGPNGAGKTTLLSTVAGVMRPRRGAITFDGTPIAGYIMDSANQEHGILCHVGGIDQQIAERFPVGTRLRILPNHACATAAQFPEYHAILPDGGIETWPRLQGW